MQKQYICAICKGPVHDFDERDNRAACETCCDWVPVINDLTDVGDTDVVEMKEKP
jgi:hypothetical protein